MKTAFATMSAFILKFGFVSYSLSHLTTQSTGHKLGVQQWRSVHRCGVTSGFRRAMCQYLQFLWEQRPWLHILRLDTKGHRQLRTLRRDLRTVPQPLRHSWRTKRNSFLWLQSGQPWGSLVWCIQVVGVTILINLYNLVRLTRVVFFMSVLLSCRQLKCPPDGSFRCLVIQ